MPLQINSDVLLAGKLGGVFTVKPSSGPHKQGESLPVGLFLRYIFSFQVISESMMTLLSICYLTSMKTNIHLY